MLGYVEADDLIVQPLVVVQACHEPPGQLEVGPLVVHQHHVQGPRSQRVIHLDKASTMLRWGCTACADGIQHFCDNLATPLCVTEQVT